MYVLNIGDKVLFSANIDVKSVSKSIEITEKKTKMTGNTILLKKLTALQTLFKQVN